MAVYNLERELDRERFKKRCNYLYERRSFVDLAEHKARRSLPQNSYLHLLLAYFALSYHDTLEYVKEEYYKRTCNRDLFVYTHFDILLGEKIERTRSSADLSSEEMSMSIDRFKIWAAKNGIYLPDAEKPEQIVQAYQELEQNKQWI